MPPAARLTDLHVCPADGPAPHVGGPVIGPCAPTVLINGLPAARQGDVVTCAGGPPASIISGSFGVVIEGAPAARLGDPTSHGGKILVGSANVSIGEKGSGQSGSLAGMTCPEKMEKAIAGAPLAQGVLDALGGAKGIAAMIVAAGVIQAIPVAGEIEDALAVIAGLGMLLAGFNILKGFQELYQFGKQCCQARTNDELQQAGLLFADAVGKIGVNALLMLLPRFTKRGTPPEENPGTLPKDPNDLLKRGYVETTHPKARAAGRRDFENPKTGDKLEFDKAKPGKPSWRGQDHYHRPNPNRTSKLDHYLDKDGNPVPDNSAASHLPPDDE